MTTQADELYERALAWRTEDPDPDTRGELDTLIAARDTDALRERFGERLEFGTAGIRGLLGAGPARMNRALVRRVSAGLGRTLLELVPDAAARGVAVAFDGRRLSPELAADTASVLSGLGLRVHWVGGPRPTPLLAFAVLELGAAAGVVVTASHNPPAYNGYKVYWDNGAQIVPPLDAAISAKIEEIGSLDEVPWLELDEARGRALVEAAPADLEERYLAALDRQALYPPLAPDTAHPRIVYTPLHGVGRPLALRALERRGVTNVRVVARQSEPDGEFPTVSFPNPEEPGALDLALELARAEDAPLVVANDPDADRLAAVVRDRDGEYRQLTGDELGALLGYHILGTHHARGSLPEEGFVVTTVVSSGLLPRMAHGYGLRCERTLTGFKWICNRAIELEKQGGVFLFGYEEALGYCVGRAVRDKDGIGALALLAEAAAHAAQQGRSLLDNLQEIEQRFGVVRTRQLSLTLPGSEGQERIRRTMQRFRLSPPIDLGGRRLLVVSDLLEAVVTDRESGSQRASGLPPSDVLQLDLEGEARVTLRPSGTEPKLKVYLEACEASDPTLEEARSRAAAALDALEAAVRDRL
jgi:phosphomannomutase